MPEGWPAIGRTAGVRSDTAPSIPSRPQDCRLFPRPEPPATTGGEAGPNPVRGLRPPERSAGKGEAELGGDRGGLWVLDGEHLVAIQGQHHIGMTPKPDRASGSVSATATRGGALAPSNAGSDQQSHPGVDLRHCLGDHSTSKAASSGPPRRLMAR